MAFLIIIFVLVVGLAALFCREIHKTMRRDHIINELAMLKQYRERLIDLAINERDPKMADSFRKKAKEIALERIEAQKIAREKWNIG